MTRTIPLKIQNEYIIGDRVLIGAAGSHNDVVLRMEFSPMWEGLAKTVQFTDALGLQTVEMLLTVPMLEGDTTNVYLVPVPFGAKKYAGEMSLAIKGAKATGTKENRATTAVYGIFTVGESKWSAEAEAEADVPPTHTAQLQTQIENILGTIQDARKAAGEAEKSKKDAAESASSAAGSAAAAAGSAAEAKKNAASAESAVSKYPYIGKDGYWMLWDPEKGAFYNSGICGKGKDGAAGEKGDPGRDGVVVEANGMYGFHVNGNGHLILSYTGDVPPNFHINSAGRLILTV